MKYPYFAIVSPWFLDRISWVIEIGNITLWPFIISRELMSDEDRNHEEVHIAQQVELAVVAALMVVMALVAGYQTMSSVPWWGFGLLFWCFSPGIGPYFAIYGLLWLAGLFRGRAGEDAYRQHPMEAEAYDNSSPTYVSERRFFAWAR